MNRFNLEVRDSLVPYELLLKDLRDGILVCVKWNVAAALKKHCVLVSLFGR